MARFGAVAMGGGIRRCSATNPSSSLQHAGLGETGATTATPFFVDAFGRGVGCAFIQAWLLDPKRARNVSHRKSLLVCCTWRN